MQNPQPIDESTGHPPTVGWLTQRWRWLLDLCQRAERRITENFRVPPGGG